ncbi:type II/IV secretion system protein [Patescibacteria group bacterium]|nr:type II/IV secretion system protein [Patescibacteria group bacterium]
MDISSTKLKKLLVSPGHISEQDFASVVRQAKTKKEDIQELIVANNLLKDEQLGQLVAEELGFLFLDLKKEKIDEAVLRLIPEIVARSKGVVAIAREKDEVKVGMIHPNDLETLHVIKKRIGEPVKAYSITKQSLKSALSLYKASMHDEFEGIIAELRNVELPRDQRNEAAVRMVNTLLQYGYDSKASDIHVEPYAKKILVRFRIDGVMHDVLEIPKELNDLILTRLKILARLRTDEHRAAQDGKLRFDAKSEIVDIRISIAPVTQGENVVMRLLSAQNRQLNLENLGLIGKNLTKVKSAIKKPHGMILVTGPTGSGKTTTLYAVIKILNKREVHIATIEDPVEYDIEGVSQIQVNTQTNLTFAKGLRALVRQDPDIIMVGEIRDEETAGIAVNSAMTGHLVLSTVHANDSATTLPRLLNMGVEPFLITSTINAVISQRLVRKICVQCRASYQLSAEEKSIIEKEPEIQKFFEARGKDDVQNIYMYKGKGCKVCGNTGYDGRTGIFEVLEMTEQIKQAILRRASSDEIMEIARKKGMVTMLEDGLEKALNGITTLQEVLRVTKL